MFEPIPIEIFRDKTGISKSNLSSPLGEVRSIVSLRHIKDVISVHAMPMDYLRKLLLNVTIAGDEDCRVYKNCKMLRMRIDPRGVRVGQTFLERPKYQNILENF